MARMLSLSRLIERQVDFEDPCFPLSLWERVRVRGFSQGLGSLAPAISRGERE